MKNIRTCIACRKKFDKTENNLIKITKEYDKIVVNSNNKDFGRSCYVCKNCECIDKVVKNKLLSKSFKKQVDISVYNELLNFKR